MGEPGFNTSLLYPIKVRLKWIKFLFTQKSVVWALHWDVMGH